MREELPMSVAKVVLMTLALAGWQRRDFVSLRGAWGKPPHMLPRKGGG